MFSVFEFFASSVFIILVLTFYFCENSERKWNIALNITHLRNIWYLHGSHIWKLFLFIVFSSSQICRLFLFIIGQLTAAMMDYGGKFITTLAEDEWCLRPTSGQKWSIADIDFFKSRLKYGNGQFFCRWVLPWMLREGIKTFLGPNCLGGRRIDEDRHHFSLHSRLL